MKRIGFVGAGKHAQCIHIPNYAALANCQVVAIADADADLARRVAARLHIPRSYGSHAELLAGEKLDAVVVTLPETPMAETVIRDALLAKLPVCVEKPLAWSVPSGARLVELAKKQRTPLFVGYHKRSDPAAVYAKNQIGHFVRTGELGAIKYARISVSLAGDWIANGYCGALKGCAAIPAQEFPPEDADGMSAVAKKAFSSIAGTESHQFDLMRYVLGHSYRIAYADPKGVLVAIESEKGVPGVIEFTPYASTKDWREYAMVCFERGYVRVDFPAPLACNRAGTVEIFRDDGGTATPLTTRPVFPARSAMFAQAENFLAALDGQTTPLCPAAEALEALVVARDWAMRLCP